MRTNAPASANSDTEGPWDLDHWDGLLDDMCRLVRDAKLSPQPQILTQLAVPVGKVFGIQSIKLIETCDSRLTCHLSDMTPSDGSPFFALSIVSALLSAFRQLLATSPPWVPASPDQLPALKRHIANVQTALSSNAVEDDAWNSACTALSDSIAVAYFQAEFQPEHADQRVLRRIRSHLNDAAQLLNEKNFGRGDCLTFLYELLCAADSHVAVFRTQPFVKKLLASDSTERQTLAASAHAISSCPVQTLVNLWRAGLITLVGTVGVTQFGRDQLKAFPIANVTPPYPDADRERQRNHDAIVSMTLAAENDGVSIRDSDEIWVAAAMYNGADTLKP